MRIVKDDKRSPYVQIELRREELKLIADTLHAVGRTFKRYNGMNTGSSQVHNVYSEDLDVYFRLSDMVKDKLT